MKVSLSWLNEYVAISDLNASAVAQALTSVGLEVETIENIVPFMGEVVVGEILQAEKHPQADTLQVCQVTTGAGEPLNIVCGAKNARTGLKVVVAKVGATLPGNFAIKEAKIRGVASFGMLCSEQELGLSESSEGILELPQDAALGVDVASYLRLNDQVLTLGITPNRGDCLGIIGIARELAAKLNRTLQLPTYKPMQYGKFASKDRIQVTIENNEESVRFTALAIDHVSAISSPQWLRQRLSHCGMRPVNLIVDITNYVMLETGQPIHAYDARDLSNKKIGVRRARAGESLTTLDEQKRDLLDTDLVITDGQRPIGLAGVMGGANSEVKADTTSIIVEVAHFSASRVRRTAKRLALHSEASHRFERGIDIARLDQINWRVATLLQQCTGDLNSSGSELKMPQPAQDLVDEYPEKIRDNSVALRSDRLRHFLHDSVDSTEASALLGRLGIVMLDKAEGRTLYRIPSWRYDLEREVDLIEEIARQRGYDKISYTLPLMEIGPNEEDPFINFVDEVKIACALAGLSEIISFPFMSQQDLDALRLPASHPYRRTLQLANPLAEHDRLLVSTLCPSLLKAAERNQRAGVQGVALFEVGRQFLDLQHQKTDGIAAELSHCFRFGRHISQRAQADQRAIERQLVAAVITSPLCPKTWDSVAETAVSFFHVKAMMEHIAHALGVDSSEISCQRPTPDALPWLHPGASAAVFWHGNYVGWIGELHPETARTLGLATKQPTGAFEFDLELMYLAKTQTKSIALTSARFPGSSRDIAFIAAADLSHEHVAKVILGFNKKKHLAHFHLFDVYTGQPIAAGKKSMAYAFMFQSPTKTLTDKEVDEEFQQLVHWLKGSLAIELRM